MLPGYVIILIKHLFLYTKILPGYMSLHISKNLIIHFLLLLSVATFIALRAQPLLWPRLRMRVFGLRLMVEC